MSLQSRYQLGLQLSLGLNGASRFTSKMAYSCGCWEGAVFHYLLVVKRLQFLQCGFLDRVVHKKAAGFPQSKGFERKR